MTTISGHTFFPHPANWARPVQWKRRWQTAAVESLGNAEQRLAVRTLPRHTLSYLIRTRSLAESRRLEARVDQATKSGLACAQFFGRGTNLAAPAPVATNTLTLADTAIVWPWAADDYAALIGEDDAVFDAWRVTAVDGPVLTLAGNLVNTWPAGTCCRPLLFGSFSPARLRPMTDWHTETTITIAQMTAERNAQLGNVVADAGVGIGFDEVGTDNNIP